MLTKALETKVIIDMIHVAMRGGNMYTVEYISTGEITAAGFARLTERNSGMVVPTTLGAVIIASIPEEMPPTRLALPDAGLVALLGNAREATTEIPLPPEECQTLEELATKSTQRLRELVLGRKVVHTATDPVTLWRPKETTRSSGLIVDAAQEFAGYAARPDELEAMERVAAAFAASPPDDDRLTGGYL